MFCPFCKKEIEDGSSKCKHCQSALTQETPLSAGDAHTVSGDVDIDSLDMSEKMKKKMYFVKNNLKRLQFGLPEYNVRGISALEGLSILAFIFTGFYYIVKGMWRKGLVLFLVGLAVPTIGVELGLPDPILIGLSFVVGIIAMQSAYYDLYRAKVLKESFWW